MGSDFKKWARKQLERHIHSVAAVSAQVIITDHAKRRMKQRKVLDAEVYHCLRQGRIEIDPEEDMKTGHLVCRMQCYGASRNLAVCAALDEGNPQIIVVTVIVK